jgi:site-specific recombinase XerC
MLYLRGFIYWTKFKHGGAPVRLSTEVDIREGQDALTRAKLAERQLKAAFVLKNGPGGRQASGVTMAAVEELHLQFLENRGYGPRRIETVANQYRNLHRHLGEHRDVMTLTAADMEAYEGARRRERHHGEHIRGQTIRRERGALRRGLRLCKRDGLIERMPFDWDDLERIESDAARKDQQGKLWPIAIINRVLSKLSTKAKTAGHEQMCRLVLMTGLRSEELARAAEFPLTVLPKPRRRSRSARAVALLHVPDDGSKTSDPRTLPLTQDALDAFTAWRHRFAKADIAHALTRASRRCGLKPGVTLRDLRKFYLSHAARLDLPATQKLAGHTKVSTTALYVDADLARSVATGVKVARLGRGSQSGAQSEQRRRKAT